MIFWIVAAALTALCVAVLLHGLLRSRAAAGTRSEFDLTVYKDQLSEIERDLDRGLLNETQASSARLEIERRMLATASKGGARQESLEIEAPGGNYQSNRWIAGALAATVPLSALGLYLYLGSPQLPAIPYADRLSLETAFQTALDEDNLAGSITELEARVEAQAFDAHAWLLLANAYGSLNRFIDAANAYSRAIEAGAKESQLYASLGEALVAASGGEVGPEARQAFAEAIRLDGRNMKALYYSGLALAQNGQFERALALWNDIMVRAGPETPWRPLLQRRIGQLQAALAARQNTPQSQGESAPAPSGSTMPQPSAEDIEAASRMTPEEQLAFVRSMVDRLAERLDSDPSDLQGWIRLARAYSVLQEPAKARQALTKASEAFAGQPQEAQANAAIAQARADLGL